MSDMIKDGVMSFMEQIILYQDKPFRRKDVFNHIFTVTENYSMAVDKALKPYALHEDLNPQPLDIEEFFGYEKSNHDAISAKVVTPMIEEDYVRMRGLHCPNCRSHDIEAPASADIDGDIATQEVFCNQCSAEWVDVYHLVGYTNLVLPGVGSVETPTK